MATPAKLSDVSKKELAEAYARLKQKTKRANEVAKAKTESMMNNLITVGSGFGMGWYIGSQEKNNASTKISDIDVDLIVGGVALAASMMDWGGKYNETLASVGSGVLASWGGRYGREMALKP
jgi:hypothetical protein